MLLGARTQMMDGKFTYEEIFRFSKECGAEALEYCCEDFSFNYRPETTEDYTLAHIRELSEKYDIKIGAVGNHLAFASNDVYYEGIQKMIPKTRTLGTDVFIISSNPPAGNPNYGAYKILYSEYHDIYKERLGHLLEIAEENGVKLALEPEPPGFIPRSCDMLNLIDEMGSDALCINFDIGHAFLTDENILTTIHQFGKRIVHSHIENLIRGEHLHRLLQDGDIDLAACLKAMADEGFQGPVAIDLYGYEYDKVLKDQIQVLAKLMGREVESHA